MMEVLKTDEFKYGQWDVTIDVKEGFGDKYCSIWCVGSWLSTPGIMYDYYRECVAYDSPEMLPVGLKKKIHARCRKLLKPYYV